MVYHVPMTVLRLYTVWIAFQMVGLREYKGLVEKTTTVVQVHVGEFN